ncbi:hypothetical protein EV702DRAFT_217 [Suillus placidus]|uniref:Uncharacterized protein n=1 Tax=Suillus placidus TaxID=48579 RepID=A0A9P7D908_9AGAM|nr:hypothetical protein EV702DRAFT_217 [Suillus placidus]
MQRVRKLARFRETRHPKHSSAHHLYLRFLRCYSSWDTTAMSLGLLMRVVLRHPPLTAPRSSVSSLGRSALVLLLHVYQRTSPQGSMFFQSPPRSALPSTPERKLSREFGAHQPMPSPLAGFPSLTSGNIWDAVPGIHKFASKLVRPPGPTPLATAFENPKKPWEEKSEASNHDGDVEDEMDSDEDEGRRTVIEVRSRSSSIATARKKYQSFGVQTNAKEMRTQSVQVSSEEDVVIKLPLKVRTRSGSMKKHWHPSSSLGVLPPVMNVAAGAEPTGLLSPAVSQVSTPRSTVPSATIGFRETLLPPQTLEQFGETTPRAERSTTPSPRSSPSRLFPMNPRLHHL